MRGRSSLPNPDNRSHLSNIGVLLDTKLKRASSSDVGTVKEDALPTESVDNPQSRQTEENPDRIAPMFLLDEIEALKEKLLRLERVALDSRTVEEDDLSQPRPTTDNDPDQLGASRVAELEDYRRKENCIYGHRKEFEAGGALCIGALLKKAFFTNLTGKPRQVTGIFSPTESLDIFDQSIDFGARRERLRQNFEWDLDRTFLAEEAQLRMREKEDNIAAERRLAEDVAKAAETGHGQRNTDSLNQEENDRHDTAAQTANTKKSVPESRPQSHLKRLNWLDFRSRSLVARDDVVIEILAGEPIITNTQDSWYGFSSGGVRKVPEPGMQVVQNLLEPGKRPVPERIRIYSPLLKFILSKILAHPVDIGPKLDFVLLRPFKALVYREEALRDWLSALEQRFLSPKKDTDVAQTGGTADAELKNSEDSDSESDEEEVAETQSEGAMEHLRTLLQFFDSEIVPRRRFLESSSCKKVEFSDLWYLFRPGMEVIGNDGKQVYRVVKVSSARHRVIPAWEMYWSGDEEKDKKSQQPFSIKCVFVDFNGKSLGPVSIDFDFPRFIGERDVTSFEVYPLGFHPHRRSDFNDSEWRSVSGLPENQRLKAKLVLRGKRFLEVAGVRQMD
ncbi:hypothetical protein KJ359_001842 [Pestalotiopsis sp. 9143b]|nr:hypothetical protein KJ359_001842 [Pestalotiopsis sp. 9143b]